jgi:hypothetical protein
VVSDALSPARCRGLPREPQGRAIAHGPSGEAGVCAQCGDQDEAAAGAPIQAELPLRIMTPFFAARSKPREPGAIVHRGETTSGSRPPFLPDRKRREQLRLERRSRRKGVTP